VLRIDTLTPLADRYRAASRQARTWPRRARVTDHARADIAPLPGGDLAGTVDGEATSCPRLPDDPGLWEDGPLANAEAPKRCFIFKGIPSTASITVSLPSLRAGRMNLPSSRAMLR